MHQDHLDELHAAVPASYYHSGVRRNLGQRYWHWRRRQRIAKMIRPTGGTVVDLGCHGGYMTEFVSARAKANHVIAIDISPQATDFIRRNHPDWETHVANIEETLPIQDGAADGVVCLDVLEHLLNPEKTILEAARISKPGAWMIIAVPSENLFWKIVWHAWTHWGPGRVWQDVHVQKFSLSNLDELFKAHGFRKYDEALLHMRSYRIVAYERQ